MALLQEWSFVDGSLDFADPTLIQPELATALEYSGGSNTRLFLHDVTGNNVNHLVLLPNPDLTFSVVDTKVPRPFPLGSSPRGLRNNVAATHLVDLSHDGMADLLRQSGIPTELSGNYSVLRRHSDGVYELFDTGLRTLQGNGRTLFADINGDALSSNAIDVRSALLCA